MAVRDLATLTLKTLMRQSPARTALVSARNAASQVSLLIRIIKNTLYNYVDEIIIVV